MPAFASRGGAPLAVCNLLGQRLDAGTLTGSQHDIARYPSGVYLFVVADAFGKVQAHKFLKQ
jgi:hypothetical protein